MTPVRRRLSFILFLSLFTLLAGSLFVGLFYLTAAKAAEPSVDTSGDKGVDKKRAQLAHIHRIVVIPPFFGTDTLLKAEQAKTSGDTGSKPDQVKTSGEKSGAHGSANAASTARIVQYAGYLQKLQDAAGIYLPQRLGKRTGLEIVSGTEVTFALQKLQITPEKMFENNGRIKGAKFPLPLAEPTRQVADALHADAVVVGVLDEPRRANGKYLFDPLYGFSYEPGYVETHGGFYLMLTEGAEGLHGYMRVRNPTSKAAGREFVLADWIDAQELMIENMMDEWTYLLPKKS